MFYFASMKNTMHKLFELKQKTSVVNRNKKIFQFKCCTFNIPLKVM